MPPKVVVSSKGNPLCAWDLDEGAWKGERIDIGASIEEMLALPGYGDLLLSGGYYPLPRALYEREAAAKKIGLDARIDFRGWEPPPAKDDDGNWIIY